MDSTHLRNLLLTLHLSALAGALGLGAWAIADTIHLAGSEDLPFSLERGGISVGFLSLATIYAGILRRRGFSLIALPSLVVSLLAVVLVGSTVRWATKSFPPSENPGQQLVISAVCFDLVLVADPMHLRLIVETRRQGYLIMRSRNPRFQRAGAIAPPLRPPGS